MTSLPRVPDTGAGTTGLLWKLPEGRLSRKLAELWEPYYAAGTALRGGSSGPMMAQNWGLASRETSGVVLGDFCHGDHCPGGLGRSRTSEQ